MKSNAVIFSFITGIAGLLISPAYALPTNQEPGGNKYKTISAAACDSLIKANEKNPDFVILDVRTPDTWKSDHLSGSINRNYYDADFDTQLNALPKTKIFLMHCQSGGRSAPTLTRMKNLNFAEVYEMAGGINAWKGKSLPTTSLLAPKLMLVSTEGLQNGTLYYGIADTLKITVTNRANDMLKFTSVTFPEGGEFLSDFDLNRNLKGSEDYTFSVYYRPYQFSKDSVHVVMNSNGGALKLNIILKNVTVHKILTNKHDIPVIYPNPANNFISFENILGPTIHEVSVVNMNGQLVRKEFDFPATNQFSVADLPEGIYFIRMVLYDRIFVNKLVVSR